MIKYFTPENKQVITLVGAGGKTSTMYYLAHEFSRHRKKVLVTTTTKIFHLDQDKERFIQAKTFEVLFSQLKKNSQEGKYLVAGLEIKGEKIIGIPSQWVDRLADLELFDIILVEGDGAARKPLKAPLSYEPVIPDSTTILIPVIGLKGVGRPLSEEVVHRSKRFAGITGLEPGQIISPQDIKKVYFDLEGYNLNLYVESKRVLPVINQADDLIGSKFSLELAMNFLSPEISVVLLTAHSSKRFKWRVFRWSSE